ncbi:trigger factor [Nitrosomonas sp. PY1]|uniref:trigger factor n=1 Tax=Nitrosomonas sp. PY1 TaxID=1803906 RepID=UPI001FC834FE|nr:trigger factor [Nitrosomonas sp. PY1]GKS68750.1 trigger factor [Nitrosomonas sp. PY1]
MESNIVENLGALKRRIAISIAPEKLQTETENRLRKIAKTAKLAGFRPGKVPLKIITQMYGAQAHQDALNDRIHDEFIDVVNQHSLKIVGHPHFESNSANNSTSSIEFFATFEVYPEISIGDLSQHSIEQLETQITDVDVDKTLDVIRKRQIRYESISDRETQEGDQVKIDFHGLLDGKDFAGGEAQNVHLIIGEGRFLKDFEASLLGMKTGEGKTFDVTFPENYHNKDLVNKTVTFEVKLAAINKPILPDIDSDFAKSLGINNGEINELRNAIKRDLENEASKRVKSKLKEQIMQTLLDASPIEAPDFLIKQETVRLMQGAQENLQGKGIKSTEIQLTPELFKQKAEYRVKLGLILAELVKLHSLKAKPEQVRSLIEDIAQSYENPEQVIKWHYSSKEHLQEAEALVLEENVVKWALDKVRLTTKSITFDELMGLPQHETSI